MSELTNLGIVKTWRHNNMTCVVRHGVFDAPCRYVEIPEGHTLYGVNYFDYLDSVRLYVHGGITFSGELDSIPGWYVGFDMAHFGDFDPLDHTKCVRTDYECEQETNRLAEQIAELK